MKNIKNLDLRGVRHFYRSLLNAWTTLKFSQEPNAVQGLWLQKEHLLCNPALNIDILKSTSTRKTLWEAGITKAGHLMKAEGWISAENLSLKLGLRSFHLAQIFFYKKFPSSHQTADQHWRNRVEKRTHVNFQSWEFQLQLQTGKNRGGFAFPRNTSIGTFQWCPQECALFCFNHLEALKSQNGRRCWDTASPLKVAGGPCTNPLLKKDWWSAVACHA